MANNKKRADGKYQDEFGHIYYVKKNNDHYIIKNQEGRVIKIDDLESFFKYVKKINGLENSVR